MFLIYLILKICVKIVIEIMTIETMQVQCKSVFIKPVILNAVEYIISCWSFAEWNLWDLKVMLYAKWDCKGIIHSENILSYFMIMLNIIHLGYTDYNWETLGIQRDSQKKFVQLNEITYCSFYFITWRPYVGNFLFRNKM